MTDWRLEVDDLIIRVLSGSASPFEEERLKRWREESPDNDLRFQESRRVWSLTAPEPVVAVSGPPSVESVIQAAAGLKESEAGVIPLSSRSPPQPRRTPRKAWGILAASVAALALGVQVVMTPGPVPMTAYEAPEDGTMTVTLADGSFVRLASGSRLEEWAVDGAREVSLEGRAFFAVSRNEARPFTVRTPVGRVQVLGTRFEVREGTDGMRTVVVEGRVAVSSPDGSVVVKAGEVARVQDGLAPRIEPVEDVYGLLDWPEGFLMFQRTPLSQVAAEVSRQFQRPLVVTGEELGDRRITAWFQNEGFEEVAQSLCLVAGALCQVSGSGISISPGTESGG